MYILMMFIFLINKFFQVFQEQDMVVICSYSITNISRERSIVEITWRCHMLYEIAIVIISNTVKFAFIVYAGTDENMNKLLLTNSTINPHQKK